MARIRSIKPEFWTSEQVLNVSRDARLLFIGLWNFCDDHGRRTFSPMQIKAQVFPSDDVDVVGLLEELEEEGLIVSYTVSRKAYLCIPTWSSHQKPSKPQPSKIPEMLAEPPEPVQDSSRNDTAPTEERSRAEWSGVEKEWSGEEDRSQSRKAKGRLSYPGDYPAAFVQIREEYPKRAGSDPNPAACSALRTLIDSEPDWNVTRVRHAVEAYRDYCERAGIANTEKVMQLSSFLGPQKQGYLENWVLAAKTVRPRGSAAIESNNQQAAEAFARDE